MQDRCCLKRELKSQFSNYQVVKRRIGSNINILNHLTGVHVI